MSQQSGEGEDLAHVQRARLGLAAEPASHDSAAEVGAERLRAAIEGDLRSTGATIAEVRSGVAFVDAQLREINTTLGRIKRHHRQLNILLGLAFLVLVAIALKVLAG